MRGFQDYSNQLKSALNKNNDFKPFGGEINISDYNGFIKGDVSGIQDFIFSVKSKGASKSLKSRSHFIEVITTICVKMVEKQFGNENFKLVYDGGGNFYGFLKGFTEGCENELQKTIDQALKFESIYVCLTAVKIDDPNFGEVWKKAEMKSGKDKQKKLKTLDFEDVFRPFGKTELFNSDEWKDFSQKLVKSEGYSIKSIEPKYTRITDKSFQIFNFEYKLSNENRNFQNQITNQLPLMQNGNIKDFEILSEQAETRTGTQKLAVLKMDVDNLGLLFQNIASVNHAKEVSGCLSWFFNQYFYQMWSKESFGNGHKYSENIYPVFAGGDDCFLIGAWDAVFEFVCLIRQKFNQFTFGALTLSASLLVIDEHFPVIRFAEMAEDALKEAKTKEKNNKNEYIKDKVSVFGEVLTWEEFYKAREISEKLYTLITKKNGESRGILDRIKNSKIGFEKLQNKIVNEGILRARSIWRLKYYLRNVKRENKEVMDALIDEYSKLLLKTVLDSNKITNPNIFPVAARWAEFLTKNKNN